jgi:hypothetical protein
VVRKNVFSEPFSIISPRQAQDKYRERTQKRDVFGAAGDMIQAYRKRLVGTDKAEQIKAA